MTTLEHETMNGPPEGRLIDPSIYESEELALPKVDGEQIDKIAAKFNGRASLDRGNPNHVALIRETRMGQTLTLIVEVTAGPPVPSFATDREGDLDAVVLSRTFTVQSVWRASPETVSRAIAEGTS
jgi:hypothetical protein